jgi:hypothetical protein
VNDQLSDAFPLARITGDPSTPFDIYIDDLLDCLHECATGGRCPGGALIAALPMRTTSLLCPSPEGLQRHIDVVAWLRKWRMAANTVKSQTIIHPANESASVAPEDRAHCWTLDGVVINRTRIQVFGDLVPGGWRVGPPC